MSESLTSNESATMLRCRDEFWLSHGHCLVDSLARNVKEKLVVENFGGNLGCITMVVVITITIRVFVVQDEEMHVEDPPHDVRRC